MWVFLRDSFLSIEQHGAHSRLLTVRARFRGDIERLFPEADVAEDETSDYRFTAAISRDRLSQGIALRLSQVDYPNLIESVHEQEDERREAYLTVWARMATEQERLYGDPEPERVAQPIVIDLEE